MLLLIKFILGFVLGAVLGSFTKALADRSLTDTRFTGRSQCTFCKKELGYLDLIPIFSYLLLKGKCRYCHKKLTKEYLVVELVVGVLIGILFSLSPLEALLECCILNNLLVIFDVAFKAFLIVIFCAVFLTDIKETLIPDRITIPSTVIALIALVLLTLYKTGLLYYTLTLSELGRYLLPPHSDYFTRHAFYYGQDLFGSIAMAIIIGLFFMALILVTKGRGMGGGDLKLGIFIGLVLGFPQAILALTLAFLTGSIVGIGLLLMKRKSLGQTIPFGPFLSIGAIIVIFWGQQILMWYERLQLM